MGRLVESEATGGAKAVRTYRLQVVVPEDRRLTIELPAEIPAGPVELIFLVPPQEEPHEAAKVPAGQVERLKALVADLEKDPRPFNELSLEERKARLRRLRGAFRGMTSGTEEFIRLKREEVELEEAKFARFRQV